MCGIAGIISSHYSKEALRELSLKMAASFAYRGPDGFGAVVEEAEESLIALAHRRLSIIDLSDNASQPMSSNSGRYIISYNGEVYNFLELKKSLPDYNFKSTSDTEAILALLEKEGIEATLSKLDGMFALAIWDAEEKALTLARDKMGEKPLYYGQVKHQGKPCFAFASELKAFQEIAEFSQNFEIDRNSLELLLRYNYIPAPYSIYKNIYKLPPASFITIKGFTALNPQQEPQNYWHFDDTTLNQTRLQAPEDELIEGLESVLQKSINSRMVADVPVGSFLSGGVDSSLITSLMQAQSNKPIKTFTIGFDEASYNEAPYAKAIAKHLGTEHTELYVKPKDALEVIPKLPYIYDEPFADASAIPTHLVCKLAKKHVTVALSGDAGDELFGGYNRHFIAPKLWSKMKHLPQFSRQIMAKAILGTPISLLDKLRKNQNMGEKLHKLARQLGAKSEAELYLNICSLWQNPKLAVLGSDAVLDTPNLQEGQNFSEYMMWQDAKTYLPNDILTKVDRASMAVSLEARVPFLSPEVMQYAWQLPLEAKIRGGSGKHILKQLLYKYVPKELIERPKMGFGVPISHWLRTDLKEWANDLLSPTLLRHQGFFDADIINRLWNKHLQGKHNMQYQLWSVLMFQAWLEEKL